MLVENFAEKVRENLDQIQRGEKAEVFTIGYFTSEQFNDINASRGSAGLPLLLSNEILYVGKHHFFSRVVKDGYLIEDLIKQIENALQNDSVVEITNKGSCLVGVKTRNDGYGSVVTDYAVFEFTAKKPKSELFCIIPKNDNVEKVKQANNKKTT
ncbi:TPA: hypothetical protein RNX01_002198 [Pasteurella multocida]|nr:hypothetical protein [Pasteurella multocida]